MKQNLNSLFEISGQFCPIRNLPSIPKGSIHSCALFSAVLQCLSVHCFLGFVLERRHTVHTTFCLCFFFSPLPAFYRFCTCNICLDNSLSTFIMSDRPLAVSPIPSNRWRRCGETRHQRCLLWAVCVGWCETCPDSSAIWSWQASYSELWHWADCQRGHTHLNNPSNGLCGLNNIDSRSHMHPYKKGTAASPCTKSQTSQRCWSGFGIFRDGIDRMKSCAYFVHVKMKQQKGHLAEVATRRRQRFTLRKVNTPTTTFFKLYRSKRLFVKSIYSPDGESEEVKGPSWVTVVWSSNLRKKMFYRHPLYDTEFSRGVTDN